MYNGLKMIKWLSSSRIDPLDARIQVKTIKTKLTAMLTIIKKFNSKWGNVYMTFVRDFSYHVEKSWPQAYPFKFQWSLDQALGSQPRYLLFSNFSDQRI